jgi:hypothetical protein
MRVSCFLDSFDDVYVVDFFLTRNVEDSHDISIVYATNDYVAKLRQS